MRVRRGLLFWGLFLIPLGGISLLVRAGVLDADRLGDAWRLWPLLLIGIGLAIVLGRTRAAILATAVIAIGAGSIAGAAVAAGPNWIGSVSACAGGAGTADEHLVRDGTFDPGAVVRIDLSCGSLDLATTSDPGWSLDAAHRGPAPLVDSSVNRLEVRTPSGRDDRRNDWTVHLPAATTASLSLTANAAGATLDLDGAHLTSLDAKLNAGDVRIAAGGATIDRLDITMNAGRIRFDAGPNPLRGDISLNAGAFDLCVPAGVGLRLDVTDQLTFVHNLSSRGLAASGSTWTREPAAGQPTIELSIDGSAASFTLEPQGGCR